MTNEELENQNNFIRWMWDYKEQNPKATLQDAAKALLTNSLVEFQAVLTELEANPTANREGIQQVKQAIEAITLLIDNPNGYVFETAKKLLDNAMAPIQPLDKTTFH